MPYLRVNRLLPKAVWFIAILLVILSLAISLGSVISQSTSKAEPGFGAALSSVHQAELAGATADEIRPLVTELNNALKLNLEALRLTSPAQSANRSALLGQVDHTLINVQSNANDLQSSAAQRTFTNKVVTYIFGIVAAAVLTFVYAYGRGLWRRYRVKRTLQMRIVLK